MICEILKMGAPRLRPGTTAFGLGHSQGGEAGGAGYQSGRSPRGAADDIDAAPTIKEGEIGS